MSQSTSIIPKQRGLLDQRRNGKCNRYFASLGTFISGFLAGFHQHFFIQGYKNYKCLMCLCPFRLKAAPLMLIESSDP